MQLFINTISNNFLMPIFSAIGDFGEVKSVVLESANKILTTVFALLGVGVGWWSIISLIKISKDRGDAGARASHIQGLQWMYGAFISAPILISVVNILIKQLNLPTIGT